MVEVPKVVYADCPNCGEETLHEVVKGKVTEGKKIFFEGVVLCSECGAKYSISLEEELPLNIPIIISEMEHSKKEGIELHPEDEIKVDDEIGFKGSPLIITAIESKGKRVGKALAKEIDTIWAKRFDKVRVKFSVNLGGRTLAREVWVEPERLFKIDEFVNLNGMKMRIHSVKVKGKLLRKGSAVAKDIVRIYGKVVR